MKLSPFDDFFKTVCQFGRCNPYIDQIIKQHGKVFGDLWGVLVLQVNLPGMTEFIADCPASMKHIQNVRTNPKQINFFYQGHFFIKAGQIFSCMVDQKLEANPQQGTCSSGRKNDDALSLGKKFFCILWHIFRGLYSFGHGVGDSTVFPINELVTVQAHRNETIFLSPQFLDGKRAADGVGYLEFCFPIVGLFFENFNVGADQWKDRKSRFSPAVRAYIGAFHE